MPGFVPGRRRLGGFTRSWPGICHTMWSITLGQTYPFTSFKLLMSLSRTFDSGYGLDFGRSKSPVYEATSLVEWLKIIGNASDSLMQ